MSKIRRVMSKEVFAWVAAAVLAGVVTAAYLQQNPIDLAAYWQAADKPSETRESEVEPTAETQTEVATETATKPAAETATEPVVEEPTEAATEATDTDSSPAPATDGSTYEFTAQAGDSYTAMARQALERYSSKHKVDTASYHALAAEVALVNTAGAPLLEVGQVVQISEGDIAAAVKEHKVAVAAATTTTAAEAATPIATETDNASNADSKDGYTYTAKAGDSYTALVRAAIAQYANDNDTTLTSAQRVAAETAIVTAASQPSIAIGQTVTIETSRVADAVRTASALTAEQQAAWLPYVALAGL